MMPRQWRRREWLMLALAQTAGLVGCGTLLHPERRGQPPGGRLDWGIVVLNALGLLFFFIPGIIAFAVDFSTGAIYLPPEPPLSMPLAARPIAAGPLEKIETGRPQPSQEDVEQIVSAHAGRPVRLEKGRFATEPMQDIGDFWAVQKRWLKRPFPASEGVEAAAPA
jgi:hypothetical protein